MKKMKKKKVSLVYITESLFLKRFIMTKKI